MKIKIATMTGANDLTVHSDLDMLSQHYPFVEWGILVSQSQTGSARFPKHEWIRDFTRLNMSIKKSLHVCGKWVRDICAGDWTLPKGLVDWRRFQRVQLNFHACSHTVTEECLMMLRAKSNDTHDGDKEHQFILQLDGVNDAILEKMRAYPIDAVPIFDKSGGAGVVPDSWPKPFPGMLCTYAGGLGPDNLKDELKRIEEVVGDAEIAVDMERKIRSTDDEIFDLKKVEKCLKAIRPYTDFA